VVGAVVGIEYLVSLADVGMEYFVYLPDVGMDCVGIEEEEDEGNHLTNEHVLYCVNYKEYVQ
jgi:hypothetical protein